MLKKILLTLVLFIIIFGVSPILINIYSINDFDPVEIIKEFENRPDNVELSETLPVSNSSEKKTLYFFGGNALDTTCEPDNSTQLMKDKSYTFPFFIQQKLNEDPHNNISILNNGQTEMNFIHTYNSILKLIKTSHPAAIVILLDHEDETTSYKKYVVPKLNILKGSIFRFLIPKKIQLEDRLLKILTEFDILTPDPEAFDKIDTYLRERQISLLKKLIEQTQSKQIKTILIKSIYNVFSLKKDERLNKKSKLYNNISNFNDKYLNLARLAEIDWLSQFRPYAQSNSIFLKKISKQDYVYLINLKDLMVENGHDIKDHFFCDQSVLTTETQKLIAQYLLNNHIFKSIFKDNASSKNQSLRSDKF